MRTMKLSSLGTLRNGMNYDKSSAKRGCKIIGVADFAGHVFPDYSTLSEIDTSIVSKDDLLKDGDILFVRSNGNKNLVGRTMYIYGITEPICYSGFCIAFRPDVTLVCPEYLFYALRAPFCKKQYSYSQQTNITNLSQGVLGAVEVPIPDLDTQRKLAKILFALDQKISLNTHICSELESMAKTLYDYWFVQFDFPDENGRPYRASGGEMVWNPQLKREIPKGWEAGTIGQIGSVISGGTPTTTREDYYCNHGIAWITPNDLSKNEDKMFISHGERDITQSGLDNSSAVLMPKHSVLLSTRAPIGYLAISSNEICTNQGFKSIVPNAGYHEYFIYYLIKRNVPAIAQQGVGTTFKEVSKDTLSNFAVPLPPKSLVNNFAEKVTPLCEKRCILEEENHELKRVRDWLLPMLMNGQARVE